MITTSLEFDALERFVMTTLKEKGMKNLQARNRKQNTKGKLLQLHTSRYKTERAARLSF
jgi:hypothetical protein